MPIYSSAAHVSSQFWLIISQEIYSNRNKETANMNTYRNTINGPMQTTSMAAIVPSISWVRFSCAASASASYKSYVRGKLFRDAALRVDDDVVDLLLPMSIGFHWKMRVNMNEVKRRMKKKREQKW